MDAPQRNARSVAPSPCGPPPPACAHAKRPRPQREDRRRAAGKPRCRATGFVVLHRMAKPCRHRAAHPVRLSETKSAPDRDLEPHFGPAPDRDPAPEQNRVRPKAPRRAEPRGRPREVRCCAAHRVHHAAGAADDRPLPARRVRSDRIRSLQPARAATGGRSAARCRASVRARPRTPARRLRRWRLRDRCGQCDARSPRTRWADRS